ncbi:hypothetical protein ACMA5I_12720 [Paracoccaceae bacterium GXU_MW_L88]
MTDLVFEARDAVTQARFLYAHCMDDVKGLIARLKAGGEDPKKLDGALRAFAKALQTLLDEQAKLGKHAATGAVLDLKGARDEILERVARWRERE